MSKQILVVALTQARRPLCLRNPTDADRRKCAIELTMQWAAVWHESIESGRKGRWPSVGPAGQLCLVWRAMLTPGGTVEKQPALTGVAGEAGGPLELGTGLG